MNNKVLNHNSSDQVIQLMTAFAKTRTFVWVQIKVIRQTKRAHPWKLDEASTILKLIAIASA